MKKNSFFFIVFIFINIIKIAAQPFEMRLVNKGGGAIGVEIRNMGSTPIASPQHLSDLIFGIKWSKSLGNNLDLVVPGTSAYTIQADGSGRQYIASSNTYFRAFGATIPVPPLYFPSGTAAWTQGTWREVLSISNNGQGTVATGTFELCELGFDALLSIQTGPNIAVSYNDHTPTITAAALLVPLPIKLISFRANPVDKQIDLDWRIAEAKNFQEFQIQRSTDGKIFTNIGNKEYENQLSNYHFEDSEALPNENYYYRLKMLDRDGSFEYSNIQQAKIDGVVITKTYPNPTRGKVNIEFVNKGKENTTLKVFDTQGRFILSQEIEGNKGSNSIVIDLSTQPKGAYLLYLDEKKVETIIVE